MSLLSAKQAEAFNAFIAAYDNFIIAGHKEPDGDCISSCLALASLLQQKGKKTLVLSAGPFKRPETKKYEPQFFSLIPENSVFLDHAKTALFIADCSTMDRLGDIEKQLEGYHTFIIDHHKTSVCAHDFCIIEPSSPATAYLVQLLYEQSGLTISEETARILFFGLSTDTGYFRFLDETSSPIFSAASRLIAKGANPRQAYSEMTGGKSFMSRKFLGVQLERCEEHFDGKLLLTWETLEDSKTFGTNNRDSDSLYQLLLAVMGAEVIVSIRQETPEKCTVGLRSRDLVDVSAIAAKYGGGGHKNASGLSVDDTIANLKDKILQDFSKILCI